MKKNIILNTVIILIAAALAIPAFSQEGGSTTDHSGHVGVLIHESTIEGYVFAYHLIDMKKGAAEMKNMKGAKESDTTHHLMVYVKDPDGRAVEGAKLGYLVVGPDSAKQKLMAMGMQGAFGANVDFKVTGTYTIKTKLQAGDKKLFDKFNYEVK